MKTITSHVDLSLPLPDGRTLPARGSTTLTDAFALSERVQGWVGTSAVSLAEHAPAEVLPEGIAREVPARVAPEPAPAPFVGEPAAHSTKKAQHATKPD